MSFAFRSTRTSAVCLLTLIPSLALAPAANAHHPGGPGNTGGAGPINTISASTLPQGKVVAGIVVDYLKLDELSDATLKDAAEHGGDHDDDHGGSVHSLGTLGSAALSAAYGITDDLMVSIRLPYVWRTDIREGELEDGEPEAHLHGDADGIGDLTALAQWRVLNNTASGTQAAVLLGFAAPTGKTNDTDIDGEVFEAEFQPGTGAWAGLFGLALTQKVGRWSFDASVLYAAVTEGTQSTDVGDRFYYNAAASYRVFGAQASGPMYAGAHDHSKHAHAEPQTGLALDLILEVNGEWKDELTVNGDADRNTGGNVVYIAPGARISKGNVSAFASVGVPVVNDFNGLQAESEVRVVSGVSIGF
jgi:hypothetical protein